MGRDVAWRSKKAPARGREREVKREERKSKRRCLRVSFRRVLSRQGEPRTRAHTHSTTMSTPAAAARPAAGGAAGPKKLVIKPLKGLREGEKSRSLLLRDVSVPPPCRGAAARPSWGVFLESWYLSSRAAARSRGRDERLAHTLSSRFSLSPLLPLHSQARPPPYLRGRHLGPPSGRGAGHPRQGARQLLPGGPVPGEWRERRDLMPMPFVLSCSLSRPSSPSSFNRTSRPWSCTAWRTSCMTTWR